MSLRLDHVAVLVHDLESALARVRDAFPEPAVGPIEKFPGEGTREVYVGDDDHDARLLLLQPMGSTGPYARRLRRHGPGLHHVAVVTSATLPDELRARHWRLVRDDAHTRWWRHTDLAWCLEELRVDPRDAPLAVELELPATELTAIDGVRVVTDSTPTLALGRARLPIHDLLAPAG